jgi:hypothetical protein
MQHAREGTRAPHHVQCGVASTWQSATISPMRGFPLRLARFDPGSGACQLAAARLGLRAFARHPERSCMACAQMCMWRCGGWLLPHTKESAGVRRGRQWRERHGGSGGKRSGHVAGGGACARGAGASRSDTRDRSRWARRRAAMVCGERGQKPRRRGAREDRGAMEVAGWRGG